MIWLLACASGMYPEDSEEPVVDSSAGAQDSEPGLTDAADLFLGTPRREQGQLHIVYCNQGTLAEDKSLALYARDVKTGQTWQAGGHAFPAPGACEEKALDCAELGLDCAAEVDVDLAVDPFDAVHELDESNNQGTFHL